MSTDIEKKLERLQVSEDWISNEHGLQKVVQGNVVSVIDEQLYLLEILEQNGKPIGIHAVVVPPNGKEREIDVPTSIISDPQFARSLQIATKGDIACTPLQGKGLAMWFYKAQMNQEAPRRKVSTETYWENGKLYIPGVNVDRAPGMEDDWSIYVGHRDDVTEEAAKAAWKEVVNIVRRNPKQIIVMGAPLGSLYKSQIDTLTFMLHLVSKSTRGKSRAVGSGMCTIGDGKEKRLLKPWNNTLNKIKSFLATASVLPVALDETGTIEQRYRDTFIESVIMGASAGQDRGRLTESQRTWDLVVLSTGERRLSSASGLDGIRRRVIEIDAPVCIKEDSDKVWKLAHGAYGFPLKWLMEEMPQLDVASAEEQLSKRAVTDIGKQHAAQLAVCAAGFVALGALVGEDVREEAFNAAVLILNDLEDKLQAEGVTVGVRLWDAVLENKSRNPDQWLEASSQRNTQLNSKSINGFVTTDNELAVFPSALKEIAASVDLDDIYAPLNDLAEQDRFVRPNGKQMQSQRRLGGERRAVYVFKLDEEEQKEEAEQFEWLRAAG